ncbi:MAG: dihydrofolate reductase family protein [Actinomycetota bacterium]
MRQLLPLFSETVDVRKVYGVERSRHKSGRPSIGLCMVMSIDGSTVVDGRSTQLSNPADHDVLVALRSAADTIVVGAGTVREEMYDAPSKKGLRVGVVTRTGKMDLNTNLFTSGAGFLIMPEDTQTPVTDFKLDVIKVGKGSVDLNRAMAQLPGNFVQLEGGALLNASMFAANLVDEINLTISPMVTGADSPRLANGAPPLHSDYQVAHILEDNGFMFIRYLRTN